MSVFFTYLDNKIFLHESKVLNYDYEIEIPDENQRFD